MKKTILPILLSLSLIFAVVGVYNLSGQQAQPAQTVQQTATHADAAVVCATSASTGGVLTFTPPGTQFFYLTEMDVQNVVGGTAVTPAAATTLVTANITGTPTWTLASGVTAGTNTQSFSVEYPTGLKSISPSSAVTITLPTFATNQVIRVNACGYYGY